MRRRPAVQRAVLAVVLAALFASFVGLSVWQVERRAWKHALIARVDQRVHAAPRSAPTRAQWPGVTRDGDEYRHVRVEGVWLQGRDAFVQAVTVFGSGYWLMTPLRQQDGTVVLVNRGYVADRTRRPVATAGATVDGLLRITEPGGRFLRRNDPAHDRWFTRDVQAIAAARGLVDVAPYFVDADGDPANAADGGAAAVAGGVPVGGLTVVAFADNHLLYAIIWSVLAALVGWALVRVIRGGPADHP